MTRPDCAACCFFRLVETKGRRRRLCMLTGEKNPYAGMYGCRFMPGQWSEIDAILGLQKPCDCGNTGDPNQVKLATAFSRKGINVADIPALDDFSASPIDHIAAKLEGSLVRPEYREVPVAHLARERTRLPFYV